MGAQGWPATGRDFDCATAYMFDPWSDTGLLMRRCEIDLNGHCQMSEVDIDCAHHEFDPRPPPSPSTPPPTPPSPRAPPSSPPGCVAITPSQQLRKLVQGELVQDPLDGLHDTRNGEDEGEGLLTPEMRQLILGMVTMSIGTLLIFGLYSFIAPRHSVRGSKYARVRTIASTSHECVTRAELEAQADCMVLIRTVAFACALASGGFVAIALHVFAAKEPSLPMMTNRGPARMSRP